MLPTLNSSHSWRSELKLQQLLVWFQHANRAQRWETNGRHVYVTLEEIPLQLPCSDLLRQQSSNRTLLILAAFWDTLKDSRLKQSKTPGGGRRFSPALRHNCLGAWPQALRVQALLSPFCPLREEPYKPAWGDTGQIWFLRMENSWWIWKAAQPSGSVLVLLLNALQLSAASCSKTFGGRSYIFVPNSFQCISQLLPVSLWSLLLSTAPNNGILWLVLCKKKDEQRNLGQTPIAFQLCSAH